jgi:hypothetical protein
MSLRRQALRLSRRSSELATICLTQRCVYGIMPQARSFLLFLRDQQDHPPSE